MKRAEFDNFIKNKKNLKRQCVRYFEKLKNTKDSWKFEPEINAFTENGLIQAYKYDGIIYDSEHKPYDLITLDIPFISKDVWYLIMSHLTNHKVYEMEKICVRMAKAAAIIWKNRGRDISLEYGPVFNTILRRRHMNYQDFFHLCAKGIFCDQWIPFDVLFRIPPGHAVEYIGKGGICYALSKYKQTYGVIRTSDNQYTGYVKRQRKNTLNFYWGTFFGKLIQDVHQPKFVSIMRHIIMSQKIESPVKEWDIFIQLIK